LQTINEIADRVAAFALLEGPANLNALADALFSDEINCATGAQQLQRKLEIPHARLRAYRAVLACTQDTIELAKALRVAAATSTALLTERSEVDLVWTFPGATSLAMRTTGGVAREIIQQSRKTLLVVGYAVTVDATRTGLAAKTLAEIAAAAERGVLVTALLHRDVNKGAFLSAWRPGVPLPNIFSWSAGNDDMASVHAKIIVADSRVAFITSANLTLHGFERNIEMGVRVTGLPASELHDRVFQLIRAKEFSKWRT
jgi:phosphatidylserine/phosphatidylglycerophosphate/cardiolipin synthase-like enzyme